MSEIKEQQPAYISRVHLKGYKSIRDLSIDFKAGLNIIIGPNGSGKTNFLEFLSDTYTGIDDNANIIGNEVDFKLVAQVKEGTFIHKIKGEFELVKDNFIFKIRETLIENKIIKLDNEVHYSNGSLKSMVNVILHHELEDEENDAKNRFSYIYDVVSIKYNNIFNKLLQNALAFRFRRKNNMIFSLSDFNQDFALIPFFTHIKFKRLIRIEKNEKPNLLDSLSISTELTDALSIFTPIKSVKFDENSHWQIEENDELVLDGVRLLFNVNDQWWNWNQLSDGTKRMFYIFCNVLNHHDLYAFIEEPELGIHPQQLSLLMDFLREQSREKQIIITTHSPQVLNELGEDELDRIIVTRHEGSERGTQMYHLSEEEKGFARQYMQNGAFLSDYWVQSGFVKEEAIG